MAKVERWYPFTVSLVLTVLAVFVSPLGKVVAHPSDNLLSAGMTAASIFIGFVGTMASILTTINSRAVQFMKRIGKLDEFVDYLWSSVRSSFGLLGVSVVILVMPGTMAEGYQWIRNGVGLLWWFTVILSTTATYRAVGISLILIQNSANEDK